MVQTATAPSLRRPKKTQLRIRLAEELTECASKGIADSKASNDQAGPLQGASAYEESKDDEQQQTFEPGLVELTGVSRQRPAIGKYHGPGYVCGTAPQFSIYEIGDPAQEQADGAGCTCEVPQ